MKYTAIALALMVAGSANAWTVTTGGKTGTYYRVGNNLVGMITGGTVQTSKGSVENMKRMMSGEADVGLIQVDALAWMATKDASVTNQVEVLGPLYQECVYIAANKDGKVQNEDDLQKEGVTIAVGKQGSGSAVTWDYMRQLEPGYKKAAVTFAGGNRALGKLAIGGDTGVDAVMWVTKPNLSHKYIQTVLNNKNLKFISVNDKDLNDKYPPLGKPIYDFKSVEFEKGFFNDSEFTTICMDAVIAARTDADEELLDAVADAVLNYKTSLLK